MKETVTTLEAESHSITTQMREMEQSFNKQGDVVSNTKELFNSLSSSMAIIEQSFEGFVSEMDDMIHNKDDVVQTIEEMSMNVQTVAATCEEVCASSDEQLTASQSVAEASEQLNHLSNDLAVVLKKFTI